MMTRMKKDPLAEKCWSCGAPPMEHCDCLYSSDARSHFNGLDPEIAELFAILAEECGEVTQRVGKILRHGVRPNPYTGVLNRQSLEGELTDLVVVVDLLEALGVLSWERINAGKAAKLERLRRPDIMHHSTLFTTSACARCGSTENVQIDGPTPGTAVCQALDRCFDPIRSSVAWCGCKYTWHAGTGQKIEQCDCGPGPF